MENSENINAEDKIQGLDNKDPNLTVNVEDVEKAWEERRYSDVLLLLKNDSVFPRELDYNDLVFEGEQKLLKQFVKDRINLHGWIKRGDLEKVKKFTAEKSKLYLSPQDHSAAFTAIKSKKFHIYAYLKSIGAGLHSEEKRDVDALNAAERNNLRENFGSYVSKNPDDLILNLKSKTKSVNPPDDFSTRKEKCFLALNMKVSEILKVVECEYGLEIIFDFDDDGVCFFNRANGLTLFRERIIYIGCNRKENEVLGTLAHELTHMTMDILFENNGEPYEKTKESDKAEFEKITQRVRDRTRDGNTQEAKIIKAVFDDYEEPFHHRELIVRVPHILAQFENGEKWLDANVPELLQFYRQQILPKCREYIDQSHLIKPKNIIKKFNEEVGEMRDIKKFPLFFRNVDHIKNFINLNKQKTLFLVTKNIRLTTFRVLQALHDKNYILAYGEFVILKLETCLRSLEDMEFFISSEAAGSLIVECESADRKSLDKLLTSLGTCKKIKILVVGVNQKEIIEEILKTGKCGVNYDEDFSLNDLDAESRDAILQKRIIFQETEMNFNQFCGKEEYFKLITGDVIEKLLGNEKCRIGGRIFGISSLEGSYAQIIQEIDIASLSRDMKTSRDIFIIIGEKDKIIQSLSDVIDVENYVANKKILVPENSDFDFRKFCENNPLKKVYLINMNAKNVFVLEQIYNPDFYMERKIKKIVVNAEKMKKENLKEIFIITGKNNLTENLQNVKYLDANEAEKFLTESKEAAHWFQVENDLLIWKNSSGSVENIRKFVDEELCKKNLISESDLIEEIADKKVVIIADEPGMGKSTTITKLYESKPIAEKHWIIRVNLKDHLNVIRRINLNELTIGKIIEVLQKFESKSELNKFFLELTLNPDKIFSKYLLLTFDGFDELLDKEDRDKTIGLLKFLKDKTKSKIWITSRLHYKTVLEDELGAFSLQFDPIDDTTKREFIKKYYRDRLNLILNDEVFRANFVNENEGTKLWVYVQELISKTSNIFKGNISNVLGTPLQLNLILDNSSDYFKKWVEGKEKRLDFFYLGNNPFEVYQNYISRKYKIYFMKKNIDEKPLQILVKSALEKCHKNLTLHLTNSDITSREYEQHTILLLLIGLIRLQDKNVQFFHFTFREFYCAQILIQFLTGDIHEPVKIIETVEQLFKEVLAESKHALIRKFINGQLENGNVKKAAKENLKSGPFSPKCLHDSILDNNSNLFDLLFSYFKQNFDHLKILKFEDNGRNLLHSAAIGGNPQIWNILIETMEEMSVENQKEIIFTPSVKHDESTVLHLAVEHNQGSVFKLLLEKVEKVLRHDLQNFFTSVNKSGKNILLLAAERNDFNIVRLVLEKAEKLLSNDERKNFFTAQNRSKDNVLSLAVQRCSSEIIQLLLDEAKTILVTPDLIRKFFTSQNEQNENVLLLAAERNNLEIIELILKEADSLPDKEKQKFFKPQNKLKENVLLLAAKQNSTEIMKLVLEKSKATLPENELGKFFMAITESKENILLLAIQKGNTEIIKILSKEAESVLKLEQRPSFFTQLNDNKENFLLLAVKQNLEVTKLLLQEIKKYVKEGRKYFLPLNNLKENALLLAVKENQLEIVKFLLNETKSSLSSDDERIFFTAKNNFGENILLCAINKNNIEMTKFILQEAEERLLLDQRKKFFREQNNLQENVLLLAIKQNNFEMFKILLEETNKNGMSDEGQKLLTAQNFNILILAIEHNNIEIIKLLLEQIENIPKNRKKILMAENTNGENVLILAVNKNNKEMVKILLEEYDKVSLPKERKHFFVPENSFKKGVLSAAVEQNNSEIIKLLSDEAKNVLATEERQKLFTELNLNDD